MEVVVATEAISRAKSQSNHHHQQTNTQLFTGRMPFLSPNQQHCHRTEGKIIAEVSAHNKMSSNVWATSVAGRQEGHPGGRNLVPAVLKGSWLRDLNWGTFVTVQNPSQIITTNKRTTNVSQAGCPYWHATNTKGKTIADVLAHKKCHPTSVPQHHCLGDRKGIQPVKILYQQSSKVLDWGTFGGISLTWSYLWQIGGLNSNWKW